MRNENYTGADQTIADAQVAADQWFGKLARASLNPPYRLSAEDRLDIIELTNMWDSSYDALDRELWLSCLTDDFVFASKGFGDFNGKKAMEAYFDTYKKVFHGLRHVISNNIVVGESPTTARGFCYLTVFERIKGTDMLGTSPFFDRYVKQGGRWIFSRRDQVVDPGMSATSAGQALMKSFTELVAQQKK